MSAPPIAHLERPVRTWLPPVARLRRIGMVVLALVVLAVLWELYKLVIPDDGIQIGDATVLPRSDDASMPHLREIFGTFGDSEVSTSAGGSTVLSSVLSAMWYSLRLAFAGFVAGVAVGMLLAIVMVRLRLVRRAILPWVVLSQTVPLIAIAPLVRRWGSQLSSDTFEWENWYSVAVISAYLAFFSVAVGMLRGLKAPDGTHLDLMRTYGTGWWRTFATLRLPASVPYLLPALRLAAAAAVIGDVVAEVSIGLRGGIGRMIIEYAQAAGGDPAKPWAPIFGAVALGLLAAGFVALLGLTMGRYRRAEVAA